MIVIYHNGTKVTGISGAENSDVLPADPVQCLITVARKYTGIIGWCHEIYRTRFCEDSVRELFHHDKMMVSYQPGGNFLPEAIGYVEDSSFIKVAPNVLFPTWRMSGAAGAVHSSVINSLGNRIPRARGLDYFLTSAAKLAMPGGLMCYSAPSILGSGAPTYPIKASVSDLFAFVAAHFKKQWTLLLFLNFLVYEKSIPVVPLIKALFAGKAKIDKNAIDKIHIRSNKRPRNKTVDVVIPTIGRKEYLLDFLNDLAAQSHLPSNVIVVEQNPVPGGVSELDYLTREWPFAIRHIFTHQPGACNARNLALDEIVSDWIFFADDDIRIEPDFLKSAFDEMVRIGVGVYNFSCLKAGQRKIYTRVHQTTIFGSGCSIITKESLGNSRFDMAFEFGFSEDLEFARQLLEKGYETVFLPFPEILHIKAPIGGFRTKPVLAWQSDPIQPKPSPTVMRYKLMHHTREQLLGYKTMLMIKFYRHQPIKNPFAYYRDFRRRWEKSIFYANKLGNGE